MVVFPRINAAPQTCFLHNNNIFKQTVTLKRDQILVSGQTSGTWVKVGTFPAGQKSYVEITNQEADGAVVADAV